MDMLIDGLVTEKYRRKNMHCWSRIGKENIKKEKKNKYAEWKTCFQKQKQITFWGAYSGRMETETLNKIQYSGMSVFDNKGFEMFECFNGEKEFWVYKSELIFPQQSVTI